MDYTDYTNELIAREESVETPDFGSGYLLLMVRRAALIYELRSNNFVKAMDTLYDPEIKGFCCIGVGQYLMGTTIDSLADDLGRHYDGFVDNYCVSMKTQKYLVSMNDGTVLKWPQRDRYGATFSGYKQIRPNLRARSFEEIASFLEYIWGF